MKKIISLVLILGILLCAAAIPAGAYVPPILGDVSNNQLIEADDATFLQRHLAGMKLPFSFNEDTADADEDGVVTVMDATQIQRYIVGAVGPHINIGDMVFEDWFLDDSNAVTEDYYQSETLEILRICSTHFYAFSPYGFGGLYKINCSLSDSWCVGDIVNCIFENYRHDVNYFNIEGDLMFITPVVLDPDPMIAYKPVIYLYPEEETGVNVRLDLDGDLMYTYPEYNGGWNVTAAPDGTLTDQSGRTYPYLFWDGKLNADYEFSTGFCVKGSDTEVFLRDSLAEMGLNNKETDDFIDFWLRFMKDNPYNVISFQTSAYTDAAKLNITPQPDTTIRVFMAWYPSDEAVDIPAQTLVSAGRSGFTAVEWGGQKCR